eukprot:TRINITY_DN7890_c0_g1_i5.p1 TRINITY_DN7890_c0_g1~~TRINITY_DN7890_c0_g1_i5.p1  ORF type:complete len:106 (+),score=39.98 TRINITY_DN7890_c0_g1_i5:26-319(+)
MIRRPPRSTPLYSSAASDVYKRQVSTQSTWDEKMSKELAELQQKLDRAAKVASTKKQNYLRTAPDYNPAESVSGIEMQLESQKLRNNYTMNALRYWH